MPYRRLVTMLAVVVSLVFAANTAMAQSPVLVNRNGQMKRTQKVKDEKQKRFRLKKGQRVLVVYERGEWYWVKNKKGQQAWVLKKYVKLKKKPKTPDPKPAPKPEPEPVVEPVSKPAPEPVIPAEPAPEPKPTPVVKPEPKVVKLPEAKNRSLPTLSTFKRPGRLSVYASEAGARVSVDGRDVGRAPVKGLSVKGGGHVVTVEKKGYVPSTAQIEVDGGEIPLALALVPTDKTRETHEGGVWMWRLIGYGALGAGGVATLAGFGLAAWGNLEAMQVRKDIDDYNKQTVRSNSEHDALIERRDTANIKFNAGAISLIAGNVVAAGGVVAYMLSGNPDRYSAYSE